jgi:hypothetical protein
MGAFRAYTLDSKVLPQLAGALEAISIRAEAVGSSEVASLGVQQMWRCSDAGGQLFNLLVTELNDKSLLGRPPGTVYLEVWPLEKRAPKRKRKEVSAALAQVEQALGKLGAIKCA